MSNGKKRGGGVPQRRGMNALDRLEAKMEARLEERQRFQTDFLLQVGCDAFMMAAADLFGMGPEQAGAAMGTYRDYVMEMMDALIEDGKGDDDLTYYRVDLDRRLKQIVGDEYFVPYDERYDETGIKVFTQLFLKTMTRIKAEKPGEE